MKLTLLSILLTLIFFAFLVINATNPVYSAVSLAVTFFIAAILLFTIGCDFLGFVFLLIYVGAIAIFFLLVIMMLRIKPNPIIPVEFLKVGPLSYFIGFIFAFEVLYPFWNLHSIYWFSLMDINIFVYFNMAKLMTDILMFGQILYTHFLVFFLMCGFILFIALIGSLMLLISFNNSTEVFLKSKKTFNNSVVSELKFFYPQFFK